MENQFTDRLCTVSIPELKLKLVLFYIGEKKVAYKLFHNGKLLFKGTEYKPSGMVGIDSLDSAMDLLGFLSLKKGDTDYTPKQIAWTETDICADLSMYVRDYEENKITDGIKYYQ